MKLLCETNRLFKYSLCPLLLSFGITWLRAADTGPKQPTTQSSASSDAADDSIAKVAKTKDSKVASEAELRDQREKLTAFSELIGEWRGVGQPKRGSNRGAWTEKSEWIWDFSKNAIAIQGTSAKSKLATKIRIEAAKQKTEKNTASSIQKDVKPSFVVEATSADKKVLKFVCRLDKNKLQGETLASDDGLVHRLTLTQLSDKRLLVLIEKRKATQKFYSRVAGVGFTRAGASLASNQPTGPICVVTGGKGTIALTHKGKTWYVCCSGCRQAFEDDPDGIIADHLAEMKELKKKKKSAK